MIITNNPYKIKLNQTIYNNIVNSINLNSITCDNCSHHDWTYHGCYYRSVDLLYRNFKIGITRIICKRCGKTHAILIQGMIPFSVLTHSDIITVLSACAPTHVDSSYFYFLKRKYRFIDFLNYRLVCLLNRRSHPIVFFPHDLNILIISFAL